MKMGLMALLTLLIPREYHKYSNSCSTMANRYLMHASHPFIVYLIIEGGPAQNIVNCMVCGGLCHSNSQWTMLAPHGRVGWSFLLVVKVGCYFATIMDSKIMPFLLTEAEAEA